MSLINKIILRVRLFDGTPRSRAYSERYLHHLFEMQTRAGVDYLRFFPETPWLYESGVRYVPEPNRGDIRGLENVKDIPTLEETKEGDCEDLAPRRAAEMRHRLNIFASPFLIWQTNPNTGKLLYHEIVRYPENGRIITEDPSARLGMYDRLIRNQQRRGR